MYSRLLFSKSTGIIGIRTGPPYVVILEVQYILTNRPSYLLN